MRLQNITAVAHPAGNRIDLAWTNPDPQGYPGICVVRREGAYPLSATPAVPADGIVIAQGEDPPSFLTETGEGHYSVKDDDLQGETVYYYALFPYRKDEHPANSVFNRHHCAAAMATAPYDLAGQMYELLPAIYHRYDTVLPKSDAPVSGSGKQPLHGQLRRFLDLPGGQLDQLHSYARALLDLYDLDQTDGRLLPFLAQWIGWQTDYRRGFDTQRNEIRSAPHVYRTIGIIPTVEATVKRIFGWESRSKEFVHNIFLSNRPERLNLWLRERPTGEQWSEPTEPFSLDFAYEGRPAAAYDNDGNLWLFYHTLRNDRWEVWYKTWVTFTLEAKFELELDAAVISLDLRQAFADAHQFLPQDAAVSVKATGKDWSIAGLETGRICAIKKRNSTLTVDCWTPSQPLSSGSSLDRHPAAALQSEKLWLFWDSYQDDDKGGKWHIRFRIREADQWQTTQNFGLPEKEAGVERRRPCVVTDDQNRLWLFWLEKANGDWQLRYAAHDGKDWHAPPSKLLSGGDFTIEDDLYVLFNPEDADRPIWIFWSRRAAAGQPNQTRWQIAYRFKQSLDPSIADWSDIAVLEKGPATDADDREPAAIITDGKIDLYWSTTRDGSWSIWRAKLDDPTNDQWGPQEPVTGTPFSQRAPLPVSHQDGLWLFHRSTESLNYASSVYRATKTVDARYAGSTTVDTRNLAKNGLRGLYVDFQTYTYDAGLNGRRTDLNWYARDTVGIYLTPSSQDPDVGRNRNLIERILRQFVPIQVRLVFIIQLADRELVYTYDFPSETEQRLIGEQVFDSEYPETYSGVNDSYYQDSIPDWLWIRSWSDQYSTHGTVDFTVSPPTNTQYRTWQSSLQVGG